MGLLLETFSRNGSVSKVIPAWCSFLRRAHANRRREWRFPCERDSWPWCRHSRWRVAGLGLASQTSELRVQISQGAGSSSSSRGYFQGCSLQRCRKSPSSMAFCLAKGASTSSDSRCLSCLNPPSSQTISHEKKKRKEKIGAVCLRKNEGVLLCFVFEQTSSFVSLFN